MTIELNSPTLVLLRRVFTGIYIITLVFMALRVEDVISIYWSLFFPPICALLVLLSLYMKQALQQGDWADYSRWFMGLGGFIVVSVTCFVFLLFLQLDEVMEANWGCVFVPAWFGIICYGILVLLLLPKLRETGQKRLALLLILYLISSVASSIMYVSYLETDSPKYMCEVVAPLLLVALFHLISTIAAKVRAKRSKTDVDITMHIVVFASLFPFCLLTCIRFMVYELPDFVLLVVVGKMGILWTIFQERANSKEKQASYQSLT